MNEPCFAPIFEGAQGLTCFARTVGYIFYLIILLLIYGLSGGRSRSIRCKIEGILFRIRNCASGNDDGNLVLPLDAYERHIRAYKDRYGKTSEWEIWMIENKGRYINSFNKAKELPSVVNISFSYESDPIAYDPPWMSEAEHMSYLARMSEGTYAGYNFSFNFNGDPATSYANVIAGISSTTSHASGNNMFLYYETIFGHEFGHVMAIPHHYDIDETTGDGQHMPPGDSICLMDRTDNQYCSGCRTALHIPLDVDNGEQIDETIREILRRLPY